ncbi:Zinc finger, RING/FYVE/PHD-type [Cinara cedri]|uniref:Zinc finger, RING/FYVE/PHD-type n=1 Tax=Cinara cedri TaxID=506608 RepID=A0A5E4N1H2_9HEMI|nr:Zinc finger, RING/FYVE/PHD-type [Cinara cedri]
MLPQTTLKRQAEADIKFINDDLDDNEITWGSKKSRIIYNYDLKSDLFSNINDSDQTESVFTQSESTIEVEEEFNYSSDTYSCSCEHDSDCNYQTSSQSDDTDTEDTEKEIILGIDNGYLGDGNFDDSFIAYTRPIPAFFKNCLNCNKVNDNPHYQSCYKCFKNRTQLVELKPNPVTKRRLKRLNKIHTEVQQNSLPFTNSQEESSTSSFQKINLSNYYEPSQSHQETSGTFGLSSLCLTKDTNDKIYFEEDICNICFLKPKNGFFNHEKTSHNYCCYSCAKRIWLQTGKCPICNIKIAYVTKKIIF